MPMTCAFESCGRPSHTMGLCQSHYVQQHRGQTLRPLFSPRAKRRNARCVCEFPGCGRKHLAKGLCKCHYRQQKSGTILHPLGLRPVVVDPNDSLTAIVPLTQGYSALIDAADGEAVGQHNWSVLIPSDGRTRYASTTCSGPSGRRNGSMSLHRFLWKHWGLPTAEQIDHRNTNGLDCRRNNLRAASFAGNNQNKARYRNNTSGFKGVVLHKATGKWAAQIQADGVRKHLGLFNDAADAAAVYAAAATLFHGDFARTE